LSEACAIVRGSNLSSVLLCLEVAMGPLRHFVIVFVTVLGIVTTGYAQSKDDIRLSITKDAMDEIGHGQLAALIERFSPKLKESASEDQLKSVMDKLTAVTGPYQKQLLRETRTVKGVPLYVSRSQFEKLKVELGLSFDENNKIDDLWIAPVSDLSAADMEESAKTVANLLAQEHFDVLSAQFNDRLKEMMTADHLDESWSHVVHHLGIFKSIKQAEKNPEFEIVDVRCEFEHGEIIVRVAFDFYGKVGFIWMLPLDEVENPQDSADLWIPAPPIPQM
jgi:hypothetical protein